MIYLRMAGWCINRWSSTRKHGLEITLGGTWRYDKNGSKCCQGDASSWLSKHARRKAGTRGVSGHCIQLGSLAGSWPVSGIYVLQAGTTIDVLTNCTHRTQAIHLPVGAILPTQWVFSPSTVQQSHGQPDLLTACLKVHRKSSSKNICLDFYPKQHKQLLSTGSNSYVILCKLTRLSASFVKYSTN